MKAPLKFEIQVEGKMIKFTRSYKFSKIGENIVTFVLYDPNISIDYIFKDITALYSSKLMGKIDIYIKSFEGAFQIVEYIKWMI